MIKFEIGEFYTFKDDFTTIYEYLGNEEFISLFGQNVGKVSWSFKYEKIKPKLTKSTDQDIIDDISELVKINLVRNYQDKMTELINKKSIEYEKIVWHLILYMLVLVINKTKEALCQQDHSILVSLTKNNQISWYIANLQLVLFV